MLYPESSNYSASDKRMQECIQSFYNDNTTLNQRYWREALIDSMFDAGDQTLWSGFYLQYPNMNKPMFNFNQLRRIRTTIGGRQRQHRKSSIVIPSDSFATDSTADQLTKVLLWNNRKENVLETISDAFDQALVTGLSLLHVWMDYREDMISGEIKVDAVPYDQFVIDCFFRKPDFSDCRGIWRRTFVNPMELRLLLPKFDVDLSVLRSNTSASAGARDGKFNYMAETLYATSGKDLMSYDEYYYRTLRDATMLIDPYSGVNTEWFGSKEDLKEYLTYFPQVRVEVKEKPTVNLAIMVNGRLAYDGRNPSGSDNYPFVGVFGYFNPALTDYSWKIQGIIRALRDSAFLGNRLHVLLLDMIESKVNSGWIYVDGKLVNPKDTYKTGQGQNIVLKPGAVIGQDIAPIVPNEIPTSYFSVLEVLASNFEKISGVNESMLGVDTGDKTISGFLSMLRQDAGLTTLQLLFDQLDRSQRLMDEIRLELITHNFTPGKVKMIIGEEPSPFFYKEEFGKYAISVVDGINTSTQRQQALAQSLQLKELGVNVPDEFILEHITIQDKNKLIEAVKREQEAQARSAEMQTQAAIQEIQAKTELAKSRAMADQGQAIERISRVGENQALAEERKAAAMRDEEQALLNMVKAANEMEGNSLDNIVKAVQAMQIIKAHQNPELAAPIKGTSAKKSAPAKTNTASKMKSKGSK